VAGPRVGWPRTSYTPGMTKLSSIAKSGVRRLTPTAEDRDRVAALTQAVRRTRRQLRQANTRLEQLQAEVDRMRLLLLDPVERLRALVARVEHYQPLYAVPGVIDAPARPSHDRAVAIAEALGDLEGLRVLDIGSSLGFMCMYLADRGAITHGWEMNARNVEVARQVAALNGIPVSFACRTLTEESVTAACAWRPDVVLMLSVLHHVIYYQGLEAARTVVAELAASGTRFVVELARADEDPDLPWSASQPDDPFAPFEAIPGGYDVSVLGTFETHLSTTARELALLTPRSAG
jgi:2-polyprenyl-3-methyl-5-hydroxy-6-metoxy-1,4-benzoquinol methylase